MSFRIETNTVFPVIIPNASTTSDGLMSAADKLKLDSLSPGGGGSCINPLGFPGADLGAKINAADAFLGAATGSICVPPGDYTFATAVTLSPGHLLYLGAGHYTNAQPDVLGIATFYLKANTGIIGDGWDTVVEVNGNYVLAVEYTGTFVGPGPGDENIQLRNFQIVPGPFSDLVDSAQSTIALNNARRPIIDHLYFNTTLAFSIALGGDSSAGNHCDGAIVQNCLFDSVFANVCNPVNATNFHIINNTFINPGRGTNIATCIDAEPNAATDACSNYVISGNIFNLEGTIGSAIQVQGGGGASVDAGVIEANTIIGSATNNSAMALNGARNLLISNNNFHGPSASNALTIINATNIVFDSNLIKGYGEVGIGGHRAISIVSNCTNSRFSNNKMFTDAVASLGEASILEASGAGNAGNYFYNNTLERNWDGTLPMISVGGVGSKAYMNTIGETFSYGFDLEVQIDEAAFVASNSPTNHAGDDTLGAEFHITKDGVIYGIKTYWAGGATTLKASIWLTSGGAALGSGTLIVAGPGAYTVLFTVPVVVAAWVSHTLGIYDTTGTEFTDSSAAGLPQGDAIFLAGPNFIISNRSVFSAGDVLPATPGGNGVVYPTTPLIGIPN